MRDVRFFIYYDLRLAFLFERVRSYWLENKVLEFSLSWI